MEQSERSSKRRYYYRKLFLYAFCIVLLGAVCGGVGIFALFPSSLGESYGQALQTIQKMEQALLAKIIWLYVVMAIIFVPAIAFLLMFYSHRIAGPAFRLGQEAKLIASGKLRADFRLRQKDSLTEIADLLKQTAVRYQDTVSALKNENTAIEAQAEAIAGMVRQGKDRAALESALDELSNSVKKIDTSLAEFRT